MVSNKTWRNRIKNCNNPILPGEYGKCLCPSCYVLHCPNRKKPGKKVIDATPYEKRFDEIDSF